MVQACRRGVWRRFRAHLDTGSGWYVEPDHRPGPSRARLAARAAAVQSASADHNAVGVVHRDVAWKGECFLAGKSRTVRCVKAQSHRKVERTALKSACHSWSDLRRLKVSNLIP